MCDYYDGGYTHLREKNVVSRKAGACSSCEQVWPAKTRMRVNTGISEGRVCEYRTCPVCQIAGEQPDHSELHLCQGWSYDPGDGQRRISRASDAEVFWYLRYCLENNEAPTVTQLAAAVRQLRIAEGDEERETA